MNKRKPTKKERCTAHHEAAHAVVQYRTADHVGGHVTIVPRQQEGWIRLGCAFDCWSDSFNSEHMEASILSLYAGGHAQRELDPAYGSQGCGSDEEQAAELLRLHGWEHREQELRERSLALTRQHWAEIVAVADELLRVRVLDDTEAEIICDAVAGDRDADLAQYRAYFGPQLEEWRKQGPQQD
jgi:hypothetical protein